MIGISLIVYTKHIYSIPPGAAHRVLASYDRNIGRSKCNEAPKVPKHMFGRKVASGTHPRPPWAQPKPIITLNVVLFIICLDRMAQNVTGFLSGPVDL